MGSVRNKIFLLCYLLIMVLITIIQTGCTRNDIIDMLLTDGFPPYIVSISPEDGEKGVSLDATIEINFSESIERSSVEQALSLTPGNPDLTYTWSSDSKTLRFKPEESFMEDSQLVYYRQATLYTIFITSDATDINLVHLEEEFSSTFSTMTVPMVSAGNNFTLCLNIKGEIWGCGNNYSGQLGNGSYENPDGFVTPLYISELKKVVAGKGGYHTLACKADGSVFAWGKNDNYQLGLGAGDADNRNTPQPVSDINTVLGDVLGIGAGTTHSLAVNQDGAVLAWGYNLRNQLGINNTTVSFSENPVLVSLFPGNAVKTECGYSFSGALTSNGVLYLWGSNWRGQLGVETDGNNSSESYYTPQERSDLGTGLDFRCGTVHTLAIIENGEDNALYSWGDNQSDQLGIPGAGDFAWSPGEVQGIVGNVIKAEGGKNCSYALTDGGHLYAWGSTAYYKLGISGIDPSAVESVETPSIVLDNVIDIAADGDHVVAIQSDGSVWTWVKNDQYQLGRPTTVEYNNTDVGERPEKVADINVFED